MRDSGFQRNVLSQRFLDLEYSYVRAGALIGLLCKSPDHFPGINIGDSLAPLSGLPMTHQTTTSSLPLGSL